MHISKIVSILFIILFFIFFITFLIKKKRINNTNSYDNPSLILLLFSLVCLIIAIAGFFIPTPNKEGFDTSTEKGFDTSTEEVLVEDDNNDDNDDDKDDDDR